MKPIETHCYNCGCLCQGFYGFDGKIYCSDCYFKIYEERPQLEDD